MSIKMLRYITLFLAFCMVFIFSFTAFAEDDSSVEESSSEVSVQEPDSQNPASAPAPHSATDGQSNPVVEDGSKAGNTDGGNDENQASLPSEESAAGQEDLWSGRKDIFFWTEEMSAAMSLACSWLNLNEKSDSYLVAMGIAGFDVDITSSVKIRNKIAKRDGEYETATELANDILTLLFSGYNPQDFNEMNLIKILYDFENTATVEDLAYTLISYDSGGYLIPRRAKNTPETIIKALLDAQNEDGSFGADNRGNITSTAQAVSALSEYMDREDVSEAVQNALHYFMANQTENGEFLYDNKPDPTCISAVIIAVSSLEIPIDDSRFVKNNKNMIDVLLGSQLSDGGFPNHGESSSGAEATETAIIAIMAAGHQSNPFIQRYYLTYDGSDSDAGDTEKGKYVWMWVPVCFMAIIIADGAVILRRSRKNKVKQDQKIDSKD